MKYKKCRKVNHQNSRKLNDKQCTCKRFKDLKEICMLIPNYGFILIL